MAEETKSNGSASAKHLSETGHSVLPEYLLHPPEDGECILQKHHTRELVVSFRVAKEILGSSFRPRESNLAIGKIRIGT